MGPSLADR
jgi:hypothetical protein